MTTNLEKQFFETFEIELIEDGTCDMDEECRNTDCNTCQRINKFNYPQITDRILLELVCLISQHITYIDTIEKLKTVEELKTWILEEVIYQYKHYGTKSTIKHQVRTLFEDGQDDG